MNKSILNYPNYRDPIRLIESLAATLLESTRKQFKQKRVHKENEMASRELMIHNKGKELFKCAMLATVDIYGDLQGIAGKSLQEITGLELSALETSNIGINFDQLEES